MLIKKVIIKGFKVFEESSLDDFHEGINTIVGANGSGKTSFFQALSLILTDMRRTQGCHDLKSLIRIRDSCKGSIPETSVEVVLDNTNGRFPLDSKEIRIRRFISTNCDQYEINGKKVTKLEIVNVFENGGFFSSNPYYLIKQGEITRLSDLTDYDRLKILKEIGGAKIYEVRRCDSLKILESSKGRREVIVDLLGQIETELKNLIRQKKKLNEFLTLKHDKKCLEFLRVQNHSINVKKQIDRNILEIYSSKKDLSNRREKSYIDCESFLEKTENNIKNISSELSEINLRLKIRRKEKYLLNEKKFKIEFLVNELEFKINTDLEKLPKLNDMLNHFCEHHNKTHKNLFKIEKELKNIKIAKSIVVKRSKWYKSYKEYFSKKRDYNSFFELSGEEKNFKMGDNENIMEKLKIILRNYLSLCTKTKIRYIQKKSNIHKKVKEISEIRCNMKSRQEKLLNLMQLRNELFERKKINEKKLEKSKITIQAMTNTLLMARKKYEKKVHPQTLKALACVQQYIQENKISGVHGTLLEVMDCSENLWTAVDTVGGRALMHLIVENDQIANKLIDELNRHQRGRLTFFCLNRLSKNLSQCNEIMSYSESSVYPLIQLIKFDDIYRPVFQQVFGKTLLTPDLTINPQLADKYQVNCVTLDGVLKQINGSVSGGYKKKSSTIAKFHDLKRADNYIRKENHKHKTIELLNQKVSENLLSVQKNIKKNVETLLAQNTYITKLIDEYKNLKDELFSIWNNAGSQQKELKIVLMNILNQKKKNKELEKNKVLENTPKTEMCSNKSEEIFHFNKKKELKHLEVSTEQFYMILNAECHHNILQQTNEINNIKNINKKLVLAKQNHITSKLEDVRSILSSLDTSIKSINEQLSKLNDHRKNLISNLFAARDKMVKYTNSKDIKESSRSYESNSFSIEEMQKKRKIPC
eukprot:gnl/TRDRNA2_/TRDRNA2_177055_c0_seq1.p1 gnl/TRDRNA2_/TRDRNA2_177055_c0~~gnl/TRDRNA2_/TRDRNA2_177055_c0_seq1.p1  ORF type:complete len:929 (-),score=-17.02 gnl/TRDRNA2_/TRDRNA2_177055_c0_seq1:947-3733(-)